MIKEASVTSRASQQPPDLSALGIDREKPRPSRARLHLWIFVPVALGAAGGFWALRKGILSAALEVRVAAVEREAAESAFGRAGVEVLTANGYVVPRRQAAVSSEIGGRLAALYVEEGDSAREGEILGVLRNEDLKAEIASARARLESAKAGKMEAEAQLDWNRLEFDRQKDLMGRKLTSQAAFDQARADLRVAEARLESAAASVHSAQAALNVAEESFEKTFIRAPFDGTVLRKEAEVGEIVTPIPASGGLTRGAIVTMADLKSCEMVVDVNEGYVTRVYQGQPADVELDAYLGVRFPARVRQIVPTADRQKATVQVKVSFLSTDRRILPEMGGKVYFKSIASPAEDASGPAAAPTTLVPKSALREIDGRSVVFLVQAGRALMRPVQVLGPAGDRLKIGAGLAGGETVIVDAPETLKDGDRVEVRAGGRVAPQDSRGGSSGGL
jgi:RND family efflux transporter MFP subunit